jgi:hypothetical protein
MDNKNLFFRNVSSCPLGGPSAPIFWSGPGSGPSMMPRTNRESVHESGYATPWPSLKIPGASRLFDPAIAQAASQEKYQIGAATLRSPNKKPDAPPLAPPMPRLFDAEDTPQIPADTLAKIKAFVGLRDESQSCLHLDGITPEMVEELEKMEERGELDSGNIRYLDSTAYNSNSPDILPPLGGLSSTTDSYSNTQLSSTNAYLPFLQPSSQIAPFRMASHWGDRAVSRFFRASKSLTNRSMSFGTPRRVLSTVPKVRNRTMDSPLSCLRLPTVKRWAT